MHIKKAIGQDIHLVKTQDKILFCACLAQSQVFEQINGSQAYVIHRGTGLQLNFCCNEEENMGLERRIPGEEALLLLQKTLVQFSH